MQTQQNTHIIYYHFTTNQCEFTKKASANIYKHIKGTRVLAKKMLVHAAILGFFSLDRLSDIRLYFVGYLTSEQLTDHWPRVLGFSLAEFEFQAYLSGGTHEVEKFVAGYWSASHDSSLRHY